MQVLLIHGAPGDGSLWDRVIDRLPTGVKPAAPTLRWFGPEPWAADGRGFGTEAHCADIVAALERMDGPAAVAAWSYSTHPALLALLRRPELFDRALLYEPGLPTYVTDEVQLAAFGRDAERAFGPVAAALAERGPEAAVEALFESSGGPGCWARVPPDRRERYLASARIMPVLMGAGEPPSAIGASDLARIRVPVTVAVGERTRPLFATASRAVARETPEARLRIVEGAGHMLPETDPQRFAALVAEWLAD